AGGVYDQSAVGADLKAIPIALGQSEEHQGSGPGVQPVVAQAEGPGGRGRRIAEWLGQRGRLVELTVVSDCHYIDILGTPGDGTQQEQSGAADYKDLVLQAPFGESGAK